MNCSVPGCPNQATKNAVGVMVCEACYPEVMHWRCLPPEEREKITAQFQACLPQLREAIAGTGRMVESLDRIIARPWWRLW